MTRRTFLRVLGSGLVGAGIVSVFPVGPATATPPSWASFRAAGQPLTYEMLRAAYEACVVGDRGPTLAVVSSSVARRLGLVYDVEIAEAA